MKIESDSPIPRGATHIDLNKKKGGTGIFFKRGSHGFIYWWDAKFKSWERSHRVNDFEGLDEIVFYEYDQD